MSRLEERKLTSEKIKRTTDVNSAEFRFPHFHIRTNTPKRLPVFALV